MGVLRHITWILGININVIGFRRTRNQNLLHCTKSGCHFPYYKFQNTTVKLLFSNIKTFIFYVFRQQIFFQTTIEEPTVHPFLIQNFQKLENPYLTSITANEICSILKGQHVELPFTLHIFSSYSYLYKRHESSIQKHLLGSKFNNDSSKTFFIFVTPELVNRQNMRIQELVFANSHVIHGLNSNNCFSFPLLREMQILTQSKREPNEEILNQMFCICDNQKTYSFLNPNIFSFKPLASKTMQKYFLYENLESLGFLSDSLQMLLKICSNISMLSFDTESLNQNLVNDEIINTDDFVNKFAETGHNKITYGVQIIYLIGLYDPLPIDDVMLIFKKYLPEAAFSKLNTFWSKKHIIHSTQLDWSYFKNRFSKIDIGQCAADLCEALQNLETKNSNVKIFHIGTNEKNASVTEPSFLNVTNMVYNFITYIYKRSVIASLVKYVLLFNFQSAIEKIFLQKHKITKKASIFYLIHRRINEIIFECCLTAFNGSNYDNYLILNSLIVLQTRMKQKMSFFKKGASISTIHLKICRMQFVGCKMNTKKVEHNKSAYLKTKNPKLLCQRKRKISYTSNTEQKQSKRQNKFLTKKNHSAWVKKKFLCNIFIKDIRNLVAPNMSLDKLGKLFNLDISKLCFPYNRATSIKELKKIKSLNALDETFWFDSFSNNSPSVENRLAAQHIFDEMKFADLYEYGVFYLIQDCVLLHKIFLTLFNGYLADKINIFVRRNFSQSSLSYHQFFILESAKQIKHTIAPKQIKNIFLNYIIKSAITGGFCTSMVHGKIDKNTIINEHFNYLDSSNIDKDIWPSLHLAQPWAGKFVNKCNNIVTLDIRSLYPSGALKKIPVNSPIFYSRFTLADFEDRKNKPKSVYTSVNKICNSVREGGDFNTDIFQSLNTHPRFFNEFYAIQYYLRIFQDQSNIRILRFQSNFTALGPFYFGNCPVDGFLSYQELSSNRVFVHIIQYNSVFRHGHLESCPFPTDEELAQKTQKVRTDMLNILNSFRQNFPTVNIRYIEISDCHFTDHKIPKDYNYNFYFPAQFSYFNFINAIIEKKLNGFLIVKNLEIKKSSQNPIFGFIIQKVEYEFKRLSQYTQNILHHFSPGKRVIDLNKSSSFMILSTEYFCWLHKTFDFESTPDILHALVFQYDYYLRDNLEKKLILRKELKELIAQETNIEIKLQYEIRAELVKLALNSCYGYTLCNLTNTKFKMFENRFGPPRHSARRKNIKMCIKLQNNVYLVEKHKRDILQSDAPFSTMLGHVGCSILFNSKIILLKRLYFLLKYLCPSRAQLLYMDTDSSHFAVFSKNLVDNVPDTLKAEFLQLFTKHFEHHKISGIWVIENIFDSAEYIGEKCYYLFNTDSPNYLSHMKGLNVYFQKQYVTQNIDRMINQFISYNAFEKSGDFVIFKTYNSKNLFLNYIPIKRYFISSTGSLPLKV